MQRNVLTKILLPFFAIVLICACAKKQEEPQEVPFEEVIALEEEAVPTEEVAPTEEVPAEQLSTQEEIPGPIEIYEKITYGNGVPLSLLKAIRAQDSQKIKELSPEHINNKDEEYAFFSAAWHDGARLSSYLCEAVMTKNPETVKLVLSYGVSPESGCSERDSAIYMAVDLDLVDITKILMDAGADINGKDAEWDSPFDRALQGGNPEMIKLFSERGAYFERKENSDKFSGEKQEAPLAYTDAPLTNAAALGNNEALKTLLESGGDPDGEAKYLYTPSPLYRAVDNNHADTVKLLLDYGANPNLYIDSPKSQFPELRKGVLGYTPLMLAAAQDKPEIVKILLEGGASPLTQVGEGKTAMDVAANQQIKDMLVAAADNKK